MYDVILADPPWTFKVYNAAKCDRHTSHKYDLMDIQDICDLPVQSITADNCALFLWATWPNILDAFKVIEAWDFTYRTEAWVWAKANKSGLGHHFGMGYYCLGGTEKVYVYTGADVKKVSLADLQILWQLGWLIHTHKGWKKLKSVMRQPPRKMVRVNHRLGSFIATPDHRMAVKSLYKPRRKDNPSLRINSHKVTYETVSRLDEMSRMALYQRNGVNLVFSTTPVESLGPIIEMDSIRLDADMGWLLGIYCAEGHFAVGRPYGMTLSLSINERHIASRIRAVVDTFPFYHWRYKNSPIPVKEYEFPEKNGLQVRVSSKRLAGVARHFVLGNRANNKSLNIPAMLQASIEFRQGFLSGILEGDGSKAMPYHGVGGYDGYYHITLASKQLIEDLLELCESIGVMAVCDPVQYRGSPSNRSKKTPCYTLRFCWPRNKTLTLDTVSVKPVRFDGIEMAITQPSYDVSVEGESFVVNGIISHNTRANTEPCLLAVRGRMPVIAHDVLALIYSPVREHSRKPDEQYAKIERLYPDARYLELFARRKSYLNWHYWGNEVENDVELL